MPYVNIPAFTGKSETDLRKYILRLSGELNFALNNIDESNLSEEIKNAVSEIKTVKKNTESISSSINLSGGKTASRGGFLEIGPTAILYGKEPVRFTNVPIGIASAPTPVHLRSGAGTQYETLTVIPAYTPFSVISITGGWANVNYDGTAGYCSTGALTLTEVESDGNIYTCTVPFPVSVTDPTVCLTLCGDGTEGFTVRLKSKNESGFTFTVIKNSNTASFCEVEWIAAGLRK